MSDFGFKIVDDLPMPEERVRAKYPFSDMDVGQCCVFEIEPGDVEAMNRLRVAASARNRRSDKRFIVRRIPDTENSVGVWRTE
tara:strand:+ start:179 stop:427 length:249 start_codon:yes stop_codon:yes gene_type:complete